MGQTTDEQDWQLAGLEDEARFPSTGWVIPAHVELEGKYLRASAHLSANALRVFPDRTLLSRFVGLGQAPDEDVVRFAQRWGLLDLCRHGLASAHTMRGGPRPHHCSRRIRDGLAYEPLTAWREHSQQARAILNLAAALHSGGPGRPRDWAEVGIDNWRVGWLQTNLSAVLTGWLYAGGVVPRFTWLNPQQSRLGIPRIVLDGDGLMGGVAALLLLAVARSEEVVPCSEPGCTSLAGPARRGAKPYCSLHRGPARDRDRQERFRTNHPDYDRDRRARMRDPGS